MAKSVILPVTGVAKSKALVHSASVYQPPKSQPVSEGAGGSVAVSPLLTFCGAGAVPWPLALKLTV